jgi:simple sugar transport system permease protein
VTATQTPPEAEERGFVQQLTTSVNWRTGLLIPFLAVVTALLIGIVLIMLTGSSFGQAMDAYAALLQGSVGSVKAISETLTAATPLILAGLSVAIAHRNGVFACVGDHYLH